jgi:UDP-N-acetylmuramoyl-L-alanyl-D-glutamate--2,6-diaminopimelate ligase
MNIRQLIDSLDVTLIAGNLADEINDIAYDSRKVGKDSLFVAIRGYKDDGHKYIEQAIQSGATCIVAESFRDLSAPCQPVALIQTPDSRLALAALASRFFDYPARSLKAVGVTGTNGKTTTCHIVKAILEAAGAQVGMLGTVLNITGKQASAATLTTPESLDLQRYLREMADSGITHAALEVSSHALTLGRIEGIEFHAVGFTNFTRDHIDFHGTMEKYFDAKKKIFDYLTANGRAVLNYDDPALRNLALELPCSVIACGLEQGAHIQAKDISNRKEGLQFSIQLPHGQIHVSSQLRGFNNVYNILLAVGIAYALGVDKDAVIHGVSNAQAVPGRFETIRMTDHIIAIVDYAHTDDALNRLIREARALTRGRIITVFGCGGNRDAGKRPLMGKIAETLSDVVIVTSDNPRYEDPNAIIQDVLSGMTRQDAMVIADREEAIMKAATLAQPGDAILVAGKGHEDYQEIRGVRFPFSDKEILKKAVQSISC